MGRFFALALSSGLIASIAYGVSAKPLAEDVNDAPLIEHWAPSEWGPDDSVGAANRISPELVMKAVGLVKQGKVATLGKVYSSDMPGYGGRTWNFNIENLPPARSWGALHGANLDDRLDAPIGQIGTQFDGPGHIGVLTSQGYVFYNGRKLSDPGVSRKGLGPMGVEHVAQKGFVCRGVLLDAVALRGRRLPIPAKPGLDDPGVISPADIDVMVKREGIAPISEGDCVFLYTGHGDLWHPQDWDKFSAEEKASRGKEFLAGEPGFGISACRYLADRKVILTGADTWSVESFTRESQGENGQPIECHIELQAKHGIWNLENLDLSQLVENKVYEFLFVWSPLKIKGGTGSPGNPMALY